MPLPVQEYQGEEALNQGQTEAGGAMTAPWRRAKFGLPQRDASIAPDCHHAFSPTRPDGRQSPSIGHDCREPRSSFAAASAQTSHRLGCGAPVERPPPPSLANRADPEPWRRRSSKYGATGEGQPGITPFLSSLPPDASSRRWFAHRERHILPGWRLARGRVEQ